MTTETIREKRELVFEISETNTYSLNYFELNKRFREYLIKIQNIKNKVNNTLNIWLNIEANEKLNFKTKYFIQIENNLG
jgi:hypothetical protein